MVCKVEFELRMINCKVEFEFFKSQTQSKIQNIDGINVFEEVPCQAQFDVSVVVPSISQS